MSKKCCCQRCCTLCIGKPCNRGIVWTISFADLGAGTEGDLSGDIEAVTSSWSPWVGTKIIPETGDPYCAYSKDVGGIVFNGGEELGDVTLFDSILITITKDEDTGDMIASFADTGFWNATGAATAPDVNLGPYERQNCHGFEISFDITVTEVFLGVHPWEDYIDVSALKVVVSGANE